MVEKNELNIVQNDFAKYLTNWIKIFVSESQNSAHHEYALADSFLVFCSFVLLLVFFAFFAGLEIN